MLEEEEETKGKGASLIEDQFSQIDRMDFEAFDFGAIDMNESIHVDMTDYNLILLKKKD